MNMLHKTAGRKSLQRKVLIPIMLIAFSISAAGVFFIRFYFNSILERQMSRRAEMLVDNVVHVLDFADTKGMLQRLILKLGNSTSVNQLNLITGSPQVVVASTKYIYIDKPVSSLRDISFQKYVEEAAALSEAAGYFEAEGSNYVYVYPFRAGIAAVNPNSEQQYILLAYLDASTINEGLSAFTWFSSGLFILLILLISGFIFFFLRRTVLLPVQGITRMIKQYEDGESSAILTAQANAEVLDTASEEIEKLSEALQSMIVSVHDKEAERDAAYDQYLAGQKHFNQIINNIDAVIYSALPEAQSPVFINSAVEKLTGFNTQDFVADPGFWISRIHQEDRHIIASSFEEQKRKDLVISEYRFMHKDGNARWFRQVVRRVLTDQKQFARIDGVIYDITSLKITEKQLRDTTTELRKSADELEERVKERTKELAKVNDVLEQEVAIRQQAQIDSKKSADEVFDLYNNAPCGYHSLSASGNFMRINDTELHWLKQTREEVIGKPFRSFLTPQSQESFDQTYPRFLERGEIHNYTLDMVSSTGTILRVLINASTVKDNDGNFLMSRTTVFDITELETARDTIDELHRDLLLKNEALEKSNQEMEIANKELESFSYSVSHDLRSPLRAIDGFGQALYEDYYEKLDEEAQEYIRRMRAATQKMAQLIDDMLNLSRVTRYTLKISDFQISPLVASIAEDLLFEQKRENVRLIIEPDVYVEADEHLLRIVLTNLLSNAIKFTSKTENPVIEFFTTSLNGKTVLGLRDNGAGFSMEYYNKLFGVFQRLHHERDFTGTGVGLAIVKRIITRHKGVVWAEGEVGKGAVFYFTLAS